jgi:hypothetical protein
MEITVSGLVISKGLRSCGQMLVYLSHGLLSNLFPGDTNFAV